MTTMISELYDALISAGADEQKAREAASALSDYDLRFTAVDKKLIEIDGKFTLLYWMIAFNLAFTMAILWKIFS